MGPITEAMTRLAGEIRAGHAARASFIKGLKGEVATMREGFRRQNKERARTVMALRHEVAADLAGAHRAWFGPTPAERRAKAEAAHVKVAAERDRLAALAMAKEEAVRHHAAPAAKKAKGKEPGPKGHAKKK